MIERLLAERIKTYAPANVLEQENVLQELMQHFVLAALARSGLFNVAMFHGGTCLRILHGTGRFSEDLDFLLKLPDPGFAWEPYLGEVRASCDADGIHFEVQDRSEADGAVKRAFLKTDSIGRELVLELPFHRHVRKRIRIKLEIDANPPAGSSFETAFLGFPVTAAVTVQSLPSGFGTKAHALLCREYTKGRDWYDLLWYVAQRIAPDLPLLQNALRQQGPWAGQHLRIDRAWLAEALHRKVEQVDWNEAQSDVSRFVTARERSQIALWGPDLFHSRVDELRRLPVP
jgi:predicted nucleotidyltransferase component of viral defense system